MSKEPRPSRHEFGFDKETRDFIDAKLGSTNRKERIEKIIELLLSPVNSNILTTKEKLDKVKLANETLKAWDRVRSSGGTPDDLNRLVNHGEIPNFENQSQESKEDEKSKLSFNTFGNTVKYTAKQIKQDDNTLRCLRCNRLIPTFEHGYDQVDAFVKHVNDTHGELTNEERSQLMGMYQK